jgi:hypothetical protein
MRSIVHAPRRDAASSAEAAKYACTSFATALAVRLPEISCSGLCTSTGVLGLDANSLSALA